jgi:hypothetical protein
MLNKIVENLKDNLEEGISSLESEDSIAKMDFFINRGIELSIKEALVLKSENELSEEEIIKKIIDISKNKIPEARALGKGEIKDVALRDRAIRAVHLNDNRGALKSHWIKLDYTNKKLLNIEKRLILSDWGEKSRAFLLRITTAIGIAIVVLATSYLAQKWGIPLPLRMGLPVL